MRDSGPKISGQAKAIDDGSVSITDEESVQASRAVCIAAWSVTFYPIITGYIWSLLHAVEAAEISSTLNDDVLILVLDQSSIFEEQ